MGIYILGIEMPKDAGTYRIEFDQCGNPYLLSENGDLELWHIISVPDHGRLIDADIICKKCQKGSYGYDGIFSDCIHCPVHLIPTIISADPADKKE